MRRSANPMTAAVTTKAARAGSHIRAKNWPPGDVEVPEDDEVREVRAGQEQRPGIGQQDAPVEQGGLRLAPAPGRIDQHGREEGHRSVEVQDRRHRPRSSGPHRRTAPRRCVRCGPAGGRQRRTDAVVVGQQTDEQEPRNQDERGPVLGGSGPGVPRAGPEGDATAAVPATARSQPSRLPKGAASRPGRCERGTGRLIPGGRR